MICGIIKKGVLPSAEDDAVREVELLNDAEGTEEVELTPCPRVHVVVAGTGVVWRPEAVEEGKVVTGAVPYVGWLSVPVGPAVYVEFEPVGYGTEDDSTEEVITPLAEVLDERNPLDAVGPEVLVTFEPVGYGTEDNSEEEVVTAATEVDEERKPLVTDPVAPNEVVELAMGYGAEDKVGYAEDGISPLTEFDEEGPLVPVPVGPPVVVSLAAVG